MNCRIIMLLGALIAAPVLAEASTASQANAELKITAETSMRPFFDVWLREFQAAHPNIRLDVVHVHRPPENRSVLGVAEDELFRSDDTAFAAKHGYLPFNVIVSSGGRHEVGRIQALGVFVHPSNPLRHLSLEQIEAIFSAAPRSGRPQIRTWGELGLTGEWANRPVVAYGRERRQGASHYFRKRALSGADYSPIYRECRNSAAVVQAVADDVGGIGYSALAYTTAGVRALALSEREGAPVAEPSEEQARALRYPLAYPLFISLDRRPGEPLPALAREFLRFALSERGQQIVAENGYLPLPADVAAWERQRLE